MFGKRKSDVLIVGAGPIGMMTALILSKNDVSVEIIDKESHATTRSHAFVLHPDTLRVLDRYSLAAPILEYAYPIETIHLYDGAEIHESVRFDSLPLPFPRAVSIPESKLEEILEDALEEAGVKIHWDHRASELVQTPHGCEVSADRFSERTLGYAVSRTERLIDKTFTFRSKLVIAADGYQSLMRRLMRLENRKMAPSQYFALFEVESDMDPYNAARMSLSKGLLTTQHPLPGKLSRLAFQFSGLDVPEEHRKKGRSPLQNGFQPDEILKDRCLSDLIASRVPWNPGYIKKILWRMVVPFELRSVENIRSGRTVLLGDAARSFGPISFTSLNRGLSEAERLALTIKSHLNDGRLLTQIDHLADEFQTEWQALYDLERRSIPVEMSDPWIGTHRNTLLANLPATGDTLERLANQLSIHLSLPHPVDI